jgi:hypothetical protein
VVAGTALVKLASEAEVLDITNKSVSMATDPQKYQSAIHPFKRLIKGLYDRHPIYLEDEPGHFYPVGYITQVTPGFDGYMETTVRGEVVLSYEPGVVRRGHIYFDGIPFA